MIKIGVYFIVIAVLVAELFKILIYANQMTCDVTTWTQSGVQSQKSRTFCIELKLCTAAILITKLHDMSTVTYPWQHNGLHTMGSTPSPFEGENQSAKKV